jgi:hypothetical protein
MNQYATTGSVAQHQTSGRLIRSTDWLARKNKMKNLAKQILAIKTNGKAGQQIFLNELAKECRSETPRPVCPKCCEPMVRTTFRPKLDCKDDVGAWLCKC